MAYVSPRMSLKVWNSSSDPYDHEQLADNWLKVDQHDHSQGRGTPIGSAGIRDGAIQANHLTPASLTIAHTASGSQGLASGVFWAHLSADWSYSSGTVVVPLDAEKYDVSGWWDTTTYRYTPQVAGFYRFSGAIETNAGGSLQTMQVTKNGVEEIQLARGLGPTGVSQIIGSALAYANGTTDYFQLVFSQGAAGTVVSNSARTYFQAEFIGRA